MKKLMIAVVCLSAISACSNDIKSTLGLRKEAPDEFTVISYPPLTVPPSFDLKEPGIDLNAQPLYNHSTSNALSAEEKALLARSNSGHIKTKTGVELEQERQNKEYKKTQKGAIRSALSQLQSSSEDEVIDPEKEKARIDSNIESSKSINEGDVSVKARKSTIDRILGN